MWQWTIELPNQIYRWVYTRRLQPILPFFNGFPLVKVCQNHRNATFWRNFFSFELAVSGYMKTVWIAVLGNGTACSTARHFSETSVQYLSRRLYFLLRVGLDVDTWSHQVALQLFLNWLAFRTSNTSPSQINSHAVEVRHIHRYTSLNGATTFNEGGAVFDNFCDIIIGRVQLSSPLHTGYPNVYGRFGK